MQNAKRKMKNANQGNRPWRLTPVRARGIMAAMAKRAEKNSRRPARERGVGDTYTGRSGQLAVMAELLLLKCNVAVPEVDEGTDVFAFLERRPEVARLQVKTARAKRYRGEEGYSALFNIPLKELRGPPSQPPVYYVLAARLGKDWGDFVVIAREKLAELYWQRSSKQVASEFVFRVQFRPEEVRLGEIDLTPFRNAWNTLPPFGEPIVVEGLGIGG
jgi:hypothetical protein